jgi:biotin carboxylase
VLTNSDHLQTQAALAAAYFDLPGKPWPATLRTKDKAELRRHLARCGADLVWSVELGPVEDFRTLSDVAVPFPAVLKPREGVASEDVVLVADHDELLAAAAAIRSRRPETALVVEEYLTGDLRTLETLGDGRLLHVLGGFRTELSPPPYFIETRMHFDVSPPAKEVEQVVAQLDALDVGFGICHTEYVVDDDGQARIIEVNYRAIGDHCDLLLAELLGVPLFELVLRTHLGEALPDDLGLRRDGVARVEYPCAESPGTLASAPDATDRTIDGVRLTYRPTRAVGEMHPRYHTNRDYLGTVMAWGFSQHCVDRVAADFVASNRWEIAP